MKDPRYLYLGSSRWVARESVPDRLLAKYDRAWRSAEDNPVVIDPATSRPFGAVWLDIVDEIRNTAGPALDREAMLQDRELRNRAAERALDVAFSRRMPWP
jgi:hypothetical protein